MQCLLVSNWQRLPKLRKTSIIELRSLTALTLSFFSAFTASGTPKEQQQGAFSYPTARSGYHVKPTHPLSAAAVPRWLSPSSSHEDAPSPEQVSFLPCPTAGRGAAAPRQVLTHFNTSLTVLENATGIGRGSNTWLSFKTCS